MTDLIADLAAALEGSCGLDYRIHEALGWQDNDECGWSKPATGERTADTGWPHYTTSLDAKLPGENIEQMAWHEVVPGEALGEVCEAWHLDLKTGKRTMGAAHTEPLARRIAYLKSAASLKAVSDG